MNSKEQQSPDYTAGQVLGFNVISQGQVVYQMQLNGLAHEPVYNTQR